MALRVLEFLPRPDTEEGVGSWTLEGTELTHRNWVTDDGTHCWSAWNGKKMIENGTERSLRRTTLAARIALTELLAGQMIEEHWKRTIEGQGRRSR